MIYVTNTRVSIFQDLPDYKPQQSNIHAFSARNDRELPKIGFCPKAFFQCNVAKTRWEIEITIFLNHHHGFAQFYDVRFLTISC